MCINLEIAVSAISAELTVNALLLARSKARKRQSDDAIDMISNNDSDSRILDFSPACLKSAGK
jgi:hypothetical protein